ncbi:hypothetical protein K8I28_04685 [bacterium]|nr:hypothetical protein [bacterium]
MGQQQLLLLVLGVIIVGVAVAVGINMFSSSAIDANRTALSSDLVHLGSKAQQHFKKPTTMGGGGNDFNGFTLGTLDQSNDNGAYRLDTTAPTAADLVTPAAGAPAAATANTAIAATADTIFILAYGTETGRDNTNLVMGFTTVTANNIATTILN